MPDVDINVWGPHGALTWEESLERRDLESKVWDLAARIHYTSRCDLRRFDNEDLKEMIKSLGPWCVRLNETEFEEKISFPGAGC